MLIISGKSHGSLPLISVSKTPWHKLPSALISKHFFVIVKVKTWEWWSGCWNGLQAQQRVHNHVISAFSIGWPRRDWTEGKLIIIKHYICIDLISHNIYFKLISLLARKWLYGRKQNIFARATSNLYCSLQCLNTVNSKNAKWTPDNWFGKILYHIQYLYI